MLKGLLATRPPPGQGWSVLLLLLSPLWLPEWEHSTQDWFWWRLTQFPGYFPSTHWKAPWSGGHRWRVWFSWSLTQSVGRHGLVEQPGITCLCLGGWVQGQDRGCRDRGSHLVGRLASLGLERACSVLGCEEQRRAQWGFGLGVRTMAVSMPTHYAYTHQASLVSQSVKNRLQCGRPGFNPRVGKLPWRRAWQLIPVFLPGELSQTEEPGGLQSIQFQWVRHNWATKHSAAHAHTTIALGQLPYLLSHLLKLCSQKLIWDLNICKMDSIFTPSCIILPKMFYRFCLVLNCQFLQTSDLTNVLFHPLLFKPNFSLTLPAHMCTLLNVKKWFCLKEHSKNSYLEFCFSFYASPYYLCRGRVMSDHLSSIKAQPPNT